MFTIDLKQYIQNRKVLSVIDNGVNLRYKLDIERIEKEHNEIKIIIPNDVYALNSSFFFRMVRKKCKKIR